RRPDRDLSMRGSRPRRQGRAERCGAHDLRPLRPADPCRLREQMSTVGFPGPSGSHSSAAAAVLAPAATGVDLPSFTAVVEAVSAAEVAVGVLPIESSLIGPIAE